MTVELPRYRIRIRGHVDPDWCAPMSVTQFPDGTTSIVGTADASALYGLLARLRDLGAALLVVERLDDGPSGEESLS